MNNFFLKITYFVLQLIFITKIIRKINIILLFFLLGNYLFHFYGKKINFIYFYSYEDKFLNFELVKKINSLQLKT